MIKQQIDPELLIAMEERQLPDFDMWEDLNRTRATFKKGLLALTKDIPPMAHIPFEDHQIPGIGNDPDVRVRLYQPNNIAGPMPAMLWIHGGGYVMGTIDVEVPMMQIMADSIGCTIVAVEYRLAPEHPFPAPLNDCYAALAWMFKQAENLNIDPKRIALSGVSAGGGLAAALALMARDKGEYQPCFQLLLCPMIDDRNNEASTLFDLTGIAWDKDSNRRGWDAYLGKNKVDDLPSYALPSRAEDLSGLPPAYIAVGSLDLFLDENITYARRLMANKVAAELHVFPGGTHAFEFRAPGIRLSRRAHYLNFEIVKQAFGIA
ncbi:alpha/beta hydrolase [Maricurvus nonylphenolicus]|uniref:alpha/beta hydrolase n=1 Tax=Maricurvus nonylphenolicus TaxID=1008307 RepID=UPI0036F3991A